MMINVTNKLSADVSYKESGWRSTKLVRPFPVIGEVEEIVVKKKTS